MAYTVRHTDKKSGTVYIYQCESYWDKEKKAPRNRQRCIGKEDPKTRDGVEILDGIAKVVAINGITNPEIAPGLVNTPITVNSKTTVVVRHPWDGDLSTYDVDIVVTDGTVITGSLYDGQTINIARNATITLQDVHIEGRLNCLGASTIILKGANEIIAPSGYPAIQAGGYGEEATIKGTGSLVAVSDESWLFGYYRIRDGLVVTQNDDTYTIARARDAEAAPPSMRGRPNRTPAART